MSKNGLLGSIGEFHPIAISQLTWQTITDLDDFLTPSQACIIPVRNPISDTNGDSRDTDIQIDENNTYYEVATYPTAAAGPSKPQKQALEKAEINLNDCLACSGCITSTESLLITMQSQAEVRQFITSHAPDCTDQDLRTPIMSISPQTLASLSAHYANKTGGPPIPLLDLLRRIRHLLAQHGFFTWDTTFARHLSLLETVREFEQRRHLPKGKMNGVASHSAGAGPLPMLASACPGWVCYAEKAQGDMLPMLSQARSSQAMMGGLVKEWWAAQMGLR